MSPITLSVSHEPARKWSAHSILSGADLFLRGVFSGFGRQPYYWV